MSVVSIRSAVAAASLAFAGTAMAFTPPTDPTGPGTPDTCQTNCGYEVGPAPTAASLAADNGPFAVGSYVVSQPDGYGQGTVYYPRGVNKQMAVVAVVPGYVSPESSIEWWGSHLASHGFVTITIGTNSPTDFPPSRARQLNAALDQVIQQSKSSGNPISGMIDDSRQGVVGWSMGGGASLRVADSGRVLASIPLAPWDTQKNFGGISTPTLIFACETDAIAPIDNHAVPFYQSIPNSTDKSYIEFAGQGHWCANGNNANEAILSTAGVSWMKLHLDKDERYRPFVCGSQGNYGSKAAISRASNTCPF